MSQIPSLEDQSSLLENNDLALLIDAELAILQDGLQKIDNVAPESLIEMMQDLYEAIGYLNEELNDYENLDFIAVPPVEDLIEDIDGDNPMVKIEPFKAAISATIAILEQHKNLL